MTTRYTLRQIEYFVAVGELGSIALASERLHISSPSISTAISQLEKPAPLRAAGGMNEIGGRNFFATGSE